MVLLNLILSPDFIIYQAISCNYNLPKIQLKNSLIPIKPLIIITIHSFHECCAEIKELQPCEMAEAKKGSNSRKIRKKPILCRRTTLKMTPRANKTIITGAKALIAVML
jgi:hypothetical protein